MHDKVPNYYVPDWSKSPLIMMSLIKSLIWSLRPLYIMSLSETSVLKFSKSQRHYDPNFSNKTSLEHYDPIFSKQNVPM
jgi:hypothetical protein